MIVSGRLKQRTYETHEGEKRTVVELEVDEVGPSLRYATAKVNKTSRNTNSSSGFGDFAAAGSSGRSRSANNSAATDDTWGSAGQASEEEPPF